MNGDCASELVKLHTRSSRFAVQYLGRSLEYQITMLWDRTNDINEIIAQQCCRTQKIRIKVGRYLICISLNRETREDLTFEAFTYCPKSSPTFKTSVVLPLVLDVLHLLLAFLDHHLTDNPRERMKLLNKGDNLALNSEVMWPPSQVVNAPSIITGQEELKQSQGVTSKYDAPDKFAAL